MLPDTVRAALGVPRPPEAAEAAAPAARGGGEAAAAASEGNAVWVCAKPFPEMWAYAPLLRLAVSDPVARARALKVSRHSVVLHGPASRPAAAEIYSFETRTQLLSWRRLVTLGSMALTWTAEGEGAARDVASFDRMLAAWARDHPSVVDIESEPLVATNGAPRAGLVGRGEYAGTASLRAADWLGGGAPQAQCWRAPSSCSAEQARTYAAAYGLAGHKYSLHARNCRAAGRKGAALGRGRARQISPVTTARWALGCSPLSRGAAEPLGALPGRVSWLWAMPEGAHFAASNSQAAGAAGRRGHGGGGGGGGAAAC